MSFDYSAEYDGYWGASDRLGERSLADADALAEEILSSCGGGRLLDIGSGMGHLVRSFLSLGLDAYGLDVSRVAVDHANALLPNRFHLGSVLDLPFEADSFDTVVSTYCLEHLSEESILQALKEIRRVARRAVYLRIATTVDRDSHWRLTVKSRAWWEHRFFEAGFRKHPSYYRVNDYAALQSDDWQITVLLESIPAAALAQYPLEVLRLERDLHMDMLRETGSRSDAHIVRYQWASSFVRPGDRVLDAACGLGYGTYVVRTATKASSFVGVDASEYGVNYAKLNFGDEDSSFRCGTLPDCLISIPDDSIDHVLCFETLEHVEDPVRLLEEFHRVLSPGGRISCSVPHDWSDETGEDPNPFHLHVYDRARFVDELSRYFDLEHLVGQTADRVKKPGGESVWLQRPRSMIEIAHDQDGIEAEWLVAVASKSPLTGDRVPYVERVFSASEQDAAGSALAFRRDYDNPWLIRSLVSIGLRTTNAGLRVRWSNAILRGASPLSADRGAALCVLAYALLANDVAETQRELLTEVDKYVADSVDSHNPTVLRWRISLMYVRGLLALRIGQREDACRFLGDVVAAPADQYSHTLLTKPAEAAYLQGMILLADGRGDEARLVWWGAFRRLSSALGDRLVQGYTVLPPPFELRELTAVLALCSRLVAALANANLSSLRPPVFYEECHADSLSQLKRGARLERVISDQRRDYLDQQLWLAELQRGKDWLEQQWTALSADCDLANTGAARFKRSLFYKIGRKIGFFKYF